MFFWHQLQPQKVNTITGETIREKSKAKEVSNEEKASERNEAEKMLKLPSQTDEIKPRRRGWAPNPCHYLGGSPVAGEPSGSGQKTAPSFHYQHQSNDYTVELREVEGAVDCPGCGILKKQLVRHLKSDKDCQKKCVEIDLESFDEQLKAFRHLNSVNSNKSKKRAVNEARFLERRGKEEDEEGFLGKHRDQPLHIV